jgi:2-oxoglutarate/2-oxoacid ferredoxin oxidoreductase subunit alpha
MDVSYSTKVLLGNEACAEGALAAGMDYFAGYPITPASEVAEILSRRLPETGGKFIQMEDEIASLGAIIGASLAGAKSMTATSGPGFSLMQENIGFAAMAETPCVIVNIMRVGPSSGVATLGAQGDVIQVRHGSHGDYPIIAIAPASVQEMFDMTANAFYLSEKYRTPVVVLADGIIAHLSEKVRLPDYHDVKKTYRTRPINSPKEYLPYDTTSSNIPPMAVYGDGYRWYTTGIIHDKTGFPCTNNLKTSEEQIRRLLGKLDKYDEDIIEVERYQTEDAKMVIVAFGVVARSAYAAVEDARRVGIKAGLLRLKTIWPFPEVAVKEMLDQADVVVVPEMNAGQIYGEIRKRNDGKCRILSLTSVNGALIRPHQIVDAIKEGLS